ncbi:PR domain zinc finger protein 5-like isoform X9 [Vanessa cardui]|uniref:PR domain zinc finger protein 5-like isoform X9 n=1 Tax=Vanessa cardui TaxID=171605 RepID=UPI001F1362B3|nr:PR domain zinc finger protein 5-like isoform X9 [Vanessa cardui]
MASKTTEWRPGPTVCRCCLTEGCYKDISTEYFWMGKREVYAEMLSETFDLSIAYSQSGGPNSHSRLICEPCISRLRDAADFKRQVQECERTFMQYLDPGSSLADLEVGVDLDKEVKVERVKEEKEQSDDDEFDDRPDFGDDDDYDDLDDQPLTKLASKVPKKESVDVLDLIDNAKVTVKRKSSSKTKVTPAKKAKTKKDIASSSKEKPEPRKKKGTIKTVNWKRRRRFYNDHRDNAAIIIEYSNACPFRWKRGAFACSHCPRTFGHFQDVFNHAQEHSNRLEAMRYARPYDNVKIEISNLKCEICHESMNGLEQLKEHLLNVHQKPIHKELSLGVTPFILQNKEMLCTHCDERFSLFSRLNSHMNQHYPNNICFHCGKSFSAVHRLKAHQLTHESNEMEHKCSKCDEVFDTRALKNYHINTTHAPENRYRCPYCNLSFKRYSDRLRHLKQLHNQSVEYPCHLCSAVFAMSDQRTKHIKNVHIKHKQFQCDFCPSKFVTAGQLKNHLVKHSGLREYQCSVCKKSYARARTLKEHMRIHNNDRRFVCEYCNNAFIQKCSLKSHMRTHHPNAEAAKIAV